MRVPSLNTAVILVAASPTAVATTCSLVSTYPCGSMTTPEPCSPLSAPGLTTSSETTAGATRRAMSASDPGGRSLAASASEIVALPVNADPVSATHQPTSPPTAPITNATTPSRANAFGCTRRPNNTSGKLNCAPLGSFGFSASSSSGTTAGPASTAPAAGSRHGSLVSVHNGSSELPLSPEASSGRCNRTPSAPAGRLNASASDSGVGGARLSFCPFPLGAGV